MLERIFLAPPDDGQGGGEAPAASEGDLDAAADAAMQDVQSGAEGQPSDTADQQAQAQAQAEAFLKLQDEKGKEVTFNSPEELKQQFHQFGMLRSDYTRKTQELAKQRKQFEQERNDMLQRLEGKQKEYEKFDKFIQQHPEVYSEIQKRINRPPSPEALVQQSQKYADEKLGKTEKRIKELEDKIAQQEAEKQRQEIFDQMKSRYEDFDESEINELMNNIVPDDPRSLVEMLYYASKGKKSPVEIEKRLAQGQQKKAQGRLMPGSGSPPPQQKEFNSLEEAEKAALAELQ